MNSLVFNWLIIALISLVLEMTSPGLFLFLSFTFGACAGAIASWLEYSFNAQVMSSLVVTFVSFLVLTFLLRTTKKSDANHHYNSNVYALKGKRGLVVKPIMPGVPGQVKIAGELWAARCQHNKEINIGSWIKVIRVQGAHVVVERVEHSQGESS